MSTVIVEHGFTARKTLITRDAARAVIAPDSEPTISNVQVNGADNDLMVSVSQLQNSQPANIAGHFLISFPTLGLTVGSHVAVKINSTIEGTDVTAMVDFSIVPASGTGRPSIDV